MCGPRITVMMPVFNGAKYLRETLESLAVQTFGGFEVICADDCSTDASRSILDEYAQRDTRFHVRAAEGGDRDPHLVRRKLVLEIMNSV